MICFIFQSYITFADKTLSFKNKYVLNGYRHFLGKVQVFYKNFELRVGKSEVQYCLSEKLFRFSTQVKF
jgi:hypothetical protein